MKKLILAVLVALMVFSVSAVAFATSIETHIDPESLAVSGNVTFTIKMNNTSSEDITGVTISNANGISFGDTSSVIVPAGGSYDFMTSVFVSDLLIEQPLVFDVTWSEAGQTMRESVIITVPRAAGPLITAKREVSAKKASPGDKVMFTYTVTNSGTEAVEKVSITDKEIAGSDPIVEDIKIQPGETFTYPYEYKMGKETVTSSPVISYVDAEKNTQTVKVSEDVTLSMVNTKLKVEVAQGIASSDGVTFTLNLTNTGNQKLSKLKITDDKGTRVNDETFSLAVGESRVLTYNVPTDAERYVSFTITGSDAQGDEYVDTTESYVVRKYIDPSLISVVFSATVTQQLNASGSIQVKFVVNNTGSLDMSTLVITEETAGEIYREAQITPGSHEIEQNIYVGEPRSLVFTLSILDPAGNPYSYTANITADYIGTEPSAQPVETSNPNEMVDSITEPIEDISNGLKTALIVIAIFTAVAVVFLVMLTVLERKQKQVMEQRRQQRERAEGDVRRRQQPTPDRGHSTGETRIRPARSYDIDLSAGGAGDTRTDSIRMRERRDRQERPIRDVEHVPQRTAPTYRPTGDTKMRSSRSIGDTQMRPSRQAPTQRPTGDTQMRPPRQAPAQRPTGDTQTRPSRQASVPRPMGDTQTRPPRQAPAPRPTGDTQIRRRPQGAIDDSMTRPPKRPE